MKKIFPSHKHYTIQYIMEKLWYVFCHRSILTLSLILSFSFGACSNYRIAPQYNYIPALERLQKQEQSANAATSGLSPTPIPISSQAPAEIVLIGSFHFAEHNLQQYPQKDLDSIKAAIIRYRPTMIFIEDVAPEAEYKRQYYDYLTKGRFSQTLDSLALRSGISSAAAPELIRQLKAELQRSPDNVQIRAKLGAALYVNYDNVNAVYQWCTCVLNNQPDLFTREQDLERYFPRNPENYCKRVQNNEIHALGSAIAYTLGLDRLYYMDDQRERQRNDSLLSLTFSSLMPHFLLRPWLYPILIDIALNNPANAVQRFIEQGNALTKSNDVNFWLRGANIYHEFTRIDAGAEWFEVWGRRNVSMIENVVRQIEEQRKQSPEQVRALIIVGMSHAPPFVAELEQQAPSYRVRTLQTLR